MDPFCGCGTTVTVAEHLKRRWIGIDITYLAINLIKRRLHDTFSSEELAPFEVIGVPADATSAAALAEENRHQFEWWALDMVEATPAQDKKKGADRGVDGILYFQEKDDGPYHKIIVQVKSGKVNAATVRELEGTRKQEKAKIAALLTLQPPTRPMREAAAAAEFYKPEMFPELRFPHLQILTIVDLFAGKQLEYPRWVPPKTFKKAARRRKGPSDQERQGELL
ncbi:MAG: restriction endonuclease, partial [Deltaproteobacteria bacterium]|nr:restriction endonuclease [Deltaproteobacteria bacterium]